MKNFKPGQRVKVLLDKDHSISEDFIEHEATFVSEHADGKWADVDLDAEHAGGVRRLSVPLSKIIALLLLFALIGCAPRRTQAQDIGQVGFRTVFQKIFGGQSNPATNIVSPNSSASPCVPTNNVPCAIPNLGQTNHFVSVTSSTSNPTFKMNLEASVDGGITWFSISDSSSDTALIGSGGVTTFTATGYYPNLRLNFIGGTNGGTFNVFYSGTFGITTPQGGNVNPSVQDRRILAVAPNNGLGLMLPGTNIVQFPPYGSTAGSLYFKYITNNCAGGTIAITAGPDFNHMVAVTTITLANVATQQSFPVPDIKASVVQFTSAACGTETFDAEMSFARPGSSGGTGTGATQVQTNGADPCASTAIAKSSAVITAPAAATTQIIAGVAGQQIFVCGYHLGQVIAVAGTYQWTTGTGGACGAATVTKTGAVPVNVGEPFSYGPGSTIFSAAAGSGVCITLTGAGDNAAGIITFVQQ